MNNQRITQMLQYWAQLYKENPNSEFTKRNFYHKLIFNDVDPKDRRVNLSNQPSNTNPNYRKAPDKLSPNATPDSTFNNWVQLYSDSTKTDCFIQENWRYFCQFVSKDNKARLAGEHIKMYIPLDADHIEYGAKLIFDFLEQNNISHLSKIGSEIRFDNIVVRLIDPMDANKLMNFVFDNPYLQEGLIKPNPFAFQVNGLALAVDGFLSFNSTVADLMKLYMDHKRDTYTLNDVNADDFYNYISTLYKDQFITHRNNILEKYFNWSDLGEENNYREVISLIIKVHNPGFTYADYLDHYATCAGLELLSERKILETNRLLIEALEAMTIRFNQNGLHQVYSYYTTADPTRITRQNGLRDRMISSRFIETMRAILNMKRMTFKEYAEQLLEQYHIDLDSLVQKKDL